jgi:hypothetical protein
MTRKIDRNRRSIRIGVERPTCSAVEEIAMAVRITEKI